MNIFKYIIMIMIVFSVGLASLWVLQRILPVVFSGFNNLTKSIGFDFNRTIDFISGKIK